MKNIFFIIFVSTFLSGCGSINNFFGGDDIDKDRIQGDRISILSLEKNLVSDPKLRDSRVVLPSSKKNLSWQYPGGSLNNSLHNVLGPTFLNQSYKLKIATGSSKTSSLMSSPIIINEKVFALGSDAKINAFNLKTKKRIWQKDISIKKERKSEGFGGGITYDDGVVYSTSGFGNVIALDSLNGNELWRLDLRIPIRSAPMSFNNIVFVITHDNQVFAIDNAKGEILWSHRGILETASVLSSNSVAIDGGLIFVPYSSGEIYAIRTLNGSVVWTDSLSRTGSSTSLSEINSITARPVVDDGKLISISHAGRMVSVDISSGERLWTLDISGTETPWVSGDWVFTLSTNSELIGISRNAGNVKWVTQLEQYLNEEEREDPIRWSGPIMVSDNLLIVSSHGVAAWVSPQTGEIIETTKIPGSFYIAPIIVDEVIYLLNDDGTLVAYN
jgi:outer membrane protein assembly factor BamB